MLACIIIKTILTIIIDSIELLFIWGFCLVTVTVLIYGLSYLSELGFQKMPVRHIQIEAIDDLDEVEADDPENPDPVNDLDPPPLRLRPRRLCKLMQFLHQSPPPADLLCPALQLPLKLIRRRSYRIRHHPMIPMIRR